jgi:hypothetical protein
MLSELLTKSAPKYPVTIHSTGKGSLTGSRRKQPTGNNESDL